MSVPLPAPTERCRSELRRAQILAAAADCFRMHGFHGASIAQISKTAGMSAGHIYHYFENKEAIIAAIVGQDLARLVSLTAEWRSASDQEGAMVELTAEGVERNLDPLAAGLKLEIVAEAARNRKVAEIVQTADRAIRATLKETLREVRRKGGQGDDAATLDGLVEVLGALFEGLLIRSIRNPELDRAVVVRLYQGMMRYLLSQAA